MQDESVRKAMRIVPLTEYPKLYRPTEQKSQTSWARDARRGRIPGAFQFVKNGDWYVDLDAHDRIVKQKIAELADKNAKEPGLSANEVHSLAEKVGLTNGPETAGTEEDQPRLF